MSSMDPPFVIESLDRAFPGSITKTTEYRGETTLLIVKNDILKVSEHLKENLGFLLLADLTAVDYLEVKSPRYEMVYHVHRFGDECEENLRIRLKCEITDNEPSIDSVTPVWSTADWLEREVYDMFGITFTGHPDLRRILMPDEYSSFPLRKDFDVRDRTESKECFEKELQEGKE